LAADVVRSLARGLATLLPSLDITALSNPAAGCVRPPGAPHRTGGASVPLSDPVAWVGHSTAPESVLRLYRLVLDRTRGLAQANPSLDRLVNVAVDGKGRRYLRGVRRALPAASAAAGARVPVADASRDGCWALRAPAGATRTWLVWRSRSALLASSTCDPLCAGRSVCRGATAAAT